MVLSPERQYGSVGRRDKGFFASTSRQGHLRWGTLDSMAYRGPERCHLCGEQAEVACPSCGNGVCNAHSLTGRLAAPARVPAALLARLERAAKRLGGPEVCERCLERDNAEAGPPVVLHRAGDPIEVEMLVEALQDSGFDARALGTRNASLLGAGQHIFDQRIEVPEGQAEAAREMIGELLSGDGAAAADAQWDAEPDVDGDAGEQNDDAGEDDADGAEGTVERRRRAIIPGGGWLAVVVAVAAMAIALLLFG